MDDLISENKIDFDSYSGDIEWTREDFEKARNLIQRFYQSRVTNDDFKLEGVPKEVQAAIESCYRVRKEEIYQAAVKKSLLENGVENLVENFDWKVKWVMGSSKMASLREALLQMSFSCAGGSSVDFEMNREKLDGFIAELEKIKNELKVEK